MAQHISAPLVTFIPSASTRTPNWLPEKEVRLAQAIQNFLDTSGLFGTGAEIAGAFQVTIIPAAPDSPVTMIISIPIQDRLPPCRDRILWSGGISADGQA